MKVFISFSTKDQGLFAKTKAALADAELEFWDHKEIRGGDPLPEHLASAVQQCRCCLFIATPHSITSDWCPFEIGAFWGAGKPIVPYLASEDISAKDLPGVIRHSHAPRGLAEAVASVGDHFESYRPAPNFFAGPGQYPLWDQLYEEASTRFDVMGVGLQGFRKAPKVSERLAALECPVRILMADPQSPFLDGFVDPQGGAESPEIVRDDIRRNWDFFTGLADQYEHIEVRILRQSYPHFFSVLNDQRVLQAGYFYTINWGPGPLWEAEAGSVLYRRVREEFDVLWELEQPGGNAG